MMPGPRLQAILPRQNSPPAHSRFSRAYDGTTRARNDRPEGKRMIISASPFTWAIGVSGGALLTAVLAFGDDPARKLHGLWCEG